MKHKDIESRRTLPLLLLNSTTLIFTILVNYFGGTGMWGNPSIGDLSNKYPTLVTPSGYAFSIWGLIYLLLIAYVAHQWYRFGIRKNKVTNEAGLWFTLSNLANAAWIYFWINELHAISVLIISFLLFCLVKLIIRHRLEIFDAPFRYIAFVWWPICIYTGWIILATVINTSVWLSSSTSLEAVLDPEIWAVLVIIIASGIYIFLTHHRNMREAALVGVWGFIAVAVNQADTSPVFITALAAAGILFANAGYHAYKNRKSIPHRMLKANHPN
jgi:membrane-associated HD superfamily phosphohydrolase